MMQRIRITTFAVVALALSVGTATAAARLAQRPAPTAAMSKVDPVLRAKLDRLAPGAKVAVSIWVDVPPLAAGRAEPYAQYLARLRSYIADRQSGVLAALARMSVTGRASIYAPVVFADLSRAQVLAIASRADVQRIYGDDGYSLTG